MAFDPNAALIDRRVIAFRVPSLIAAMEQVGPSLGLITGQAVTDAATLPAEQAVLFQLGHGPAAERRRVGGAELAALLIAYCLGAKIPLPSRATKSISVTGNGVLLDLVVSLASPPRCVSKGAPPAATTRPAPRP